MSKLKEKLKELQSKLEEVRLYGDIIADLEEAKKMGAKKDTSAPIEKVMNAVIGFCKSQIDSIEEDAPERKIEVPGPSLVQPKTKEDRLETKKEELTQAADNDPLRFLVKHKHLQGKTVKVSSKNGEVVGKVVSLAAPTHVVVTTETGYTIQVTPDKLEVLEDESA